MADPTSLAHEAAAALGEGWTVTRHSDQAHSLVHGDGRVLNLWFLRRSGRVQITGSYPASRHVAAPSDSASISASADRSGQALAREITRRLMPRYTAELADIRRRIADAERCAQARAAVLDQLRQVLPSAEDTPRHDHLYYFTLAQGSGEVRAQGDGSRVQLVLPSLPVQDAERVARLLTELAGPQPSAAAGEPPSGTPGQDAGTCAQCSRLLLWDRTGRRVHDECGEYLCGTGRDSTAASAVHVLSARAERDGRQAPTPSRRGDGQRPPGGADLDRRAGPGPVAGAQCRAGGQPRAAPAPPPTDRIPPRRAPCRTSRPAPSSPPPCAASPSSTPPTSPPIRGR